MYTDNQLVNGFIDVYKNRGISEHDLQECTWEYAQSLSTNLEEGENNPRTISTYINIALEEGFMPIEGQDITSFTLLGKALDIDNRLHKYLDFLEKEVVL